MGDENKQGGDVRDDIRGTGWLQQMFPDQFPQQKPDAGDPPKVDEPASGDPKPGNAENAKPEAPGEAKPESKEAPGAEAKPGASEKKEEPKPAAPTESAAASALGLEPVAPKTPADPQPTKQQVDVSAVAEAAAEAATRTIGKMAPPNQPKAQEADELTDDVKKALPVLEEMERINPGKYKDVAKRLSKFQRQEAAYAEQWERSHQGQAFNADDEEHAAWYARNEVKVDRGDRDDARVSIRAREVAKKEIAPQQERIERELARVRVEPAARQAASAVTGEVFRAFSKENLTPESFQKLQQEDPDAADVAMEVDATYRPVAEAVPLLYHGVIDASDPEVAPVAKAARKMLSAFEGELSSLDPSRLVRGGKRWVPMAKFISMSPSDQASSWAVGPDEIVSYVRNVAVAEAKGMHAKRVEAIESRARARGWVKASGSNTGNQQAQTPSSQPASNANASASGGKSPSPGVGKVGDVTPATTTPGGSDPLAPLWNLMGHK